MTAINIDRLTLKLSGLSDHQGQHLARLVGEGLANVSMTATSYYQIDNLNVDVTARSADSMDWLAKQIVADVLRQLDRTLA
jgi:hypothetical protein